MKSFFIALAVIIISGLFFYFSSYFGHAWILAWLAPIPVLIYGYHNSLLKTGIVSFIASLASELNNIVGYWPTDIPSLAFIKYSLIQCAAWVLVVLFSCWLVKRIKNPIGVLAYPCCLALMEWLMSLTEHGTFASIANTQLSVLPVIQLASLTGFVGVSFILALFAAGISHLIAFWKIKWNAFIGFFISILGAIATIAFGFYQLRAAENNASTNFHFKVGLASVSRPPKQIFNPQNASQIFSIYQVFIEQLAAQGAKLILLPEEAFSVDTKNSDQFKKTLATTAAFNHAYIIIGVREEKNKQYYDSAWVFTPQGKLIGEYQKRHFVPGVEKNLTAGKNLLSFIINEKRAGIAICRDMDYPHPAYNYGALATQLLFVPAWDFDVDAELHRKGALLESIQNGYTLVRAARSGYLSVSTPQGKILAQQLAFSAKGDILLIDVPVSENKSFHAQHPYWFVLVLWLMLLSLVLIALL